MMWRSSTSQPLSLHIVPQTQGQAYLTFCLKLEGKSPTWLVMVTACFGPCHTISSVTRKNTWPPENSLPSLNVLIKNTLQSIYLKLMNQTSNSIWRRWASRLCGDTHWVKGCSVVLPNSTLFLWKVTQNRVLWVALFQSNLLCWKAKLSPKQGLRYKVTWALWTCILYRGALRLHCVNWHKQNSQGSSSTDWSCIISCRSFRVTHKHTLAQQTNL